MRSLRALPRGLATGRGRRQEALRRHRAASLIGAAALVALLAADAAGGDPDRPRPKPPRIELLTRTEQGVLHREAIEVEVDSRQGERVGVEADLVIDGYPDDYPFQLGPEHERLEGGEARVRFPLSARQREVLDFAIKSCRGATLSISAKVRKRTATIGGHLKRPADCRPG